MYGLMKEKKGVKMDRPVKCECSDPLCPICHGHCDKTAVMSLTPLYRVDMEDHIGTLMCKGCAEDAFSAGVFDNEPPD